MLSIQPVINHKNSCENQSAMELHSKFHLRIAVILILLITVNFESVAFESPHFGFFVKHEVNGDNYIAGVGSEIWLVNSSSNFGASFLTSIGQAQAIDVNGQEHDYVAWELGMKLGYFSDVFAYAEVGFDLGELAFQDRDEDGDYRIYQGQGDSDFVIANRSHYDDANNIDGYIGIGAGFKFSQLQIEAFTRLRQVDGEFWKADNQAYAGAKLSVVF
jgi:hypothetical protein